MPWLTEPLRRFGDRLGTVLFRVPDGVKRDDDRLAALLAAWPRDLPLTMEFQDPSWHVDEVFAALAGGRRGALHDGAARGRRRRRRSGGPGPFLYLRLRRHDYTPEDLAAWAARLEPFTSDGLDAFVFFRHDDAGRGAELALEFSALTGSAARGAGRDDADA